MLSAPTLYETQFVDIKVNLDRKKSSFSVPGVLEVQTVSFANPATGEEQDTKIQLPKGLVWKLAEAAKSASTGHPSLDEKTAYDTFNTNN